MELVATERFDDLARLLASGASRRSVLAGLASGLLVGLPLPLGGEDAAARKRRKKKKKKTKKGGSGGTLPPPLSPPGCRPNCDGRTCGPDGCGGTCGDCANNEICDGGTCVCVPQCAPANACGVDGCGGSCGTCLPNQTCAANQVTVHECRNGVCTPVTTNCAPGQVCHQNACCTRQAESSCHKQPESDGCGGTYPPNCGQQQHCCDGPNGDLVCRSLPCP